MGVERGNYLYPNRCSTRSSAAGEPDLQPGHRPGHPDGCNASRFTGSFFQSGWNPQPAMESLLRRGSWRLALFCFRFGAVEPEPADVVTDALEPSAHSSFFGKSDQAMGYLQSDLSLHSDGDHQPVACRRQPWFFLPAGNRL